MKDENDENVEEIFPKAEDVIILEENDPEEEHVEPASNEINADFIKAYKDKDKAEKAPCITIS